MSESKKVKLSEEEKLSAYEKIKEVCMKKFKSNKDEDNSESVLKKYFGGHEPILNINDAFPDEKKSGWNPLMLATYFNSVAEIKSLIALGAKSDLPIGEEKINVLHVAAGQGKPIPCRIFLSNGVHVDSLSKSLMTPMMRCCESGSFEVAEELMKKKANVKLRDIHNKTCIDYGNENNNFSIVRYIQYSFLQGSLGVNSDFKKNVAKI